MHVVVVGCGRVGSSLVLRLTEAGHTASVIDRRPEAFARLGEAFTGRKVAGIGFDRDRLREAGIEEADAVAAVTNGDNSNILIARVAREEFGIEKVVARIYDPRRAAIYQRLGIPTVATVSWATERVLHFILPDDTAAQWVDPSARVSLVERIVSEPWVAHPVGDLEVPGSARVAVLVRLGVGQVPKPDLLLQEGDVVYLTVDAEAAAEVEAHLAKGPGGHR